MDINEARRLMAIAMKKEMDHYRSVVEKLKLEQGDVINDSDIGAVFPSMSQEDADTRMQLQKDVNSLGARLASYPELFDELQPWMVDISGKGSCSNERLEKTIMTIDAPDEDKFKAFIDEFGNLASEIQAFIIDAGFEITDRGGGSCGWDLGIPCNEPDSRRLCTLLHSKYAKAIELGLITVYRKFWDWKVPEIRNFNGVEQYFENFPL
jgi:hypothetical protein